MALAGTYLMYSSIRPSMQSGVLRTGCKSDRGFTDTSTERTIAVNLRSRVKPVNPVVARNEIEPLLSELIRQLSAEGRATEQAIYRRIRRSLCDASNACELNRPFTDLSTMSQVRPNESGDASVLLARILEKARTLVLPTETPLFH